MNINETILDGESIKTLIRSYTQTVNVYEVTTYKIGTTRVETDVLHGHEEVAQFVNKPSISITKITVEEVQ